MSATFILTTKDAELSAEWTKQVPVPPLTFTDAEALLRELQRPGARVWVRDVADGHGSFAAHPDTVTILVGEPRSVPF